jgi:hypothetical protein
MHMGVSPTPYKEVKHRGFAYPAQQPLADHYGSETEHWAQVGSADMDGDLSYEFNQVTVFQHKMHGGLIIAADSGCSCPSPFENAVVEYGTFLNTLADFDAFVAEHEQLRTVWNDDYSASEEKRHPSVVDQIARLRATLEPLIAAQPKMIEEAPTGLIEG